MSRWIRLQTSIFEHEAFAADPFSEREAWLWLIAKAAWKDTKHRVGNNVVSVPTGSVFLTLREMQHEWRWKSDYKVRTFLKMLEKERMVLLETNAGKTQVTICNYIKYQQPANEYNAEPTHGQRTANALKTPVYQDTNTDDVLLSAHGDFESKILEAAGEMIHPHGAIVVGPILSLITAGADLELDVLPAIRATVARMAHPARSWSYFVPAIQAAFDRRIAAGKWEPSTRAQPPPKLTAHQQRHKAAMNAFDRQLGIKPDDEPASNIIDLEGRDFRSL